ncbi:MAG: cytidylate kinase-like family protein [bacterium]|nr:cytidylate kinase-like family protein [bacterium]
MAKSTLGSAASTAVERQMQRWALSLQVEKRHGRLGTEEAAARLHEGVQPFVAISREAGTGGGHIATLVADALECPRLGRELLESMAEKYNLEKGMLKLVDEQTTNWLAEIFGRWIDSHLVTQTAYVTHLSQVIIFSARDTKTVLVGRGAQFILPRAKGLAVRIIAPRPRRVERIMKRRSLDRQAADDFVVENDQGRRELIERYFRRDVADPSLYDLVINLQHLDHERAAELIVDQYRQRFGDL